jgi:hypothetical protein
MIDGSASPQQRLDHAHMAAMRSLHQRGRAFPIFLVDRGTGRQQRRDHVRMALAASMTTTRAHGYMSLTAAFVMTR